MFCPVCFNTLVSVLIEPHLYPLRQVVVEYGADLHTSKHGSGFPLKKPGVPLRPGAEKYAVSGWNLNNLPNLPVSYMPLCHIRTLSHDICHTLT